MARKLERHDAKRLYCEELKEIPEISRMVNVPEKTVYRWKTEDKESGVDWDKEREEIRMTSFSAAKSMLRAVVTRLDSMVKEIAETNKINPGEVYALRQLLKSAKEIQKDVDALGNIMLMVEELTGFMGERDPAMLQRLHPYLVEFGNEMSRKYGRK
jgi:transposase